MLKKIIFTFFVSISIISASILLKGINEEGERLRQIQKGQVSSQKPSEQLHAGARDASYLFYTDKDISSNASSSLPEPAIEPETSSQQSPTTLPTEEASRDIITDVNELDTLKLQENTRKKQLVEEVLGYAESCLGTPYVWGGTRKGSGMDCSGFVQYVYSQVGYKLPRVSADQSKVGKLVKRTELKVGDLLFFDTTNYRDRSDITTPEKECEYAEQVASGYAPNVVSHVGMYVGNNMMIHAASGSGYVRYETIESDYYKVRFINARRLIKD